MVQLSELSLVVLLKIDKRCIMAVVSWILRDSTSFQRMFCLICPALDWNGFEIKNISYSNTTL